jgi:uncharacterized RDD family membrane protein YckC
MIYAGFWVRAVAHLIDFVLLNAVELALEYGISTPLHLSTFAQQGVGVVLFIGIWFWYYCRYQVTTGTTIGKKLFSIYVVDERTGQFLSHQQAIIRTLGYLVSYAIIGCGFLMAAFHPQKRALHDLFAGTVSVIKTKEEILQETVPSGVEAVLDATPETLVSTDPG